MKNSVFIDYGSMTMKIIVDFLTIEREADGPELRQMCLR